MKAMTEGDIYVADFGAEQTSTAINGIRPAIVVKCRKNSLLAHVVPLTTSLNKHDNWMHIKIEGHGLKKPSTVLIEQVRLIDKAKLIKHIGTISGSKEMDVILGRLTYFFEPKAC